MKKKGRARDRERKTERIRAWIAVGPFRKPTKQHVFAHNSNTVSTVCKKVWLAIARRIIGTRVHHHTQLDCCRITRLAEISTLTHTHSNTRTVYAHAQSVRYRYWNPLFNINFGNHSIIVYHQNQSNYFQNKYWLIFRAKTNPLCQCKLFFSIEIFNETNGQLCVEKCRNETGLSIFTSNSPKSMFEKWYNILISSTPVHGIAQEIFRADSHTWLSFHPTRYLRLIKWACAMHTYRSR